MGYNKNFGKKVIYIYQCIPLRYTDLGVGGNRLLDTGKPRGSGAGGYTLAFFICKEKGKERQEMEAIFV